MQREERLTKFEFVMENYSDDVEFLRMMVNEVNAWDGGLDEYVYYENDSEFFEIYFHGNPYEVARACHYGDYRFMDDYVKFDGYGNLESIDEWDYERELEDGARDIVEEYLERLENGQVDDVDDIESAWDDYNSWEEDEEDEEEE